MPPELSICIPAYNAALYIGQALSSVLRQGIPDCEIIVVDNASEDCTANIVKAIGDPRIRYYRNTKNVGSRENFNIAVKYARGEFIKFFCADDVLIEGIVSAQLEVLRQHPDVVLVTCDMIITDENLIPIEFRRSPPGTHSGSDIITLCLSGLSNYIGGPSNIMVRRKALQGVVMDSKYRWNADLKFNLDILKQGVYVNVDRPGFFYRRHPQTDSAVNCPSDVRSSEWKQLLGEYSAWNFANTVQFIQRYRAVDGALLSNVLKALAHPLRSAHLIREVWKMRNIWREGKRPEAIEGLGL